MRRAVGRVCTAAAVSPRWRSAAAAGAGEDDAEVVDCDYVIVGGGTAGCVLANRLSADPRNKVVMLEAGDDDDWVWLKIPVGYLFANMNDRVDWCFHTTPQPGLGGRVMTHPRGKVMGGSSAINGQIYMRGQRADYEKWGAAAGGWSWNEVLPYFKKSMDYYKGADDVHGVGGEWTVGESRVRWDVLDLFERACEESGIPFNPHFNNSDAEGCGYFQVNQRHGVRVTAASAFLDPIRHRANLQIIPRATAEKLNFEDAVSAKPASLSASQRAKGGSALSSLNLFSTLHPDAKRPQARAPAKKLKIRAHKEYVLAMGAIGSPHLLQVSGVGPDAWLREHGVDVVRDVPALGRNLHDHLQLRPVFRLADDAVTLNQLYSTLWGQAKMVMEYATKQSGPLSMAPSQFGVMAKSRPDVATPDVEFHVQPLSLDRLDKRTLHNFPGLTVSVCNLRPTSHGEVKLTSDSVATAPHINPNYLATEEDKRTAVDSIRLVRKLMAAPVVAKKLTPSEFKPGSDIESDDAILESLPAIASSIFHPVSTCRMGDNAADNVVDAQLRMHAVPNVRVVDASVMPTIPSGNTCSPVIMIAEKAADMMLAAHA